MRVFLLCFCSEPGAPRRAETRAMEGGCDPGAPWPPVALRSPKRGLCLRDARFALDLISERDASVGKLRENALQRPSPNSAPGTTRVPGPHTFFQLLIRDTERFATKPLPKHAYREAGRAGHDLDKTLSNSDLLGQRATASKP